MTFAPTKNPKKKEPADPARSRRAAAACDLFTSEAENTDVLVRRSQQGWRTGSRVDGNQDFRIRCNQPGAGTLRHDPQNPGKEVYVIKFATKNEFITLSADFAKDIISRKRVRSWWQWHHRTLGRLHSGQTQGRHCLGAASTIPPRARSRRYGKTLTPGLQNPGQGIAAIPECCA